MADSSAPAPAPPTEAVANMHLDSVTGEMVSKSELKKRQKNRERDAKKAEKAAAAPPKPVAAKKDNAEADEKALDPRQYFEIRSRAINKCASPPSLSTSELRLLTSPGCARTSLPTLTPTSSTASLTSPWAMAIFSSQPC